MTNTNDKESMHCKRCWSTAGFCMLATCDCPAHNPPPNTGTGPDCACLPGEKGAYLHSGPCRLLEIPSDVEGEPDTLEGLFDELYADPEPWNYPAGVDGDGKEYTIGDTALFQDNFPPWIYGWIQKAYLLGKANKSEAVRKARLEGAREERAAKDVAYSERNKMVAVLSRLFYSHLTRHSEEDTEWEDDWRWIVCVHTPAGQAAWHIHDSERHLFESLPVDANDWDGHTTEEKYERLMNLALLQDPTDKQTEG